MLSNQHHGASKCSPIHPAAFGPDGTRTLFCFQNTCTCVCSRLPPPSSVLTVFFRPFFSPPAGELRAADAAGGLEGKNLRACVAVAMRWNLLPPPPYYPSPLLFVVLFSSASRLSRSGCLWPPSHLSLSSHWVNNGGACLCQQGRDTCAFARLKIATMMAPHL